MTTRMTKRLEFDAAHRLMNHETKCRNAHGHRYFVDVTIALTFGGLDDAGRIVDFGEVKRIFGGWLDEHIDHAFIVNVHDVETLRYVDTIGSKFHLVHFESSAENLSAYFLKVAREMLDAPGRSVVSVVVFETPSSSAEST